MTIYKTPVQQNVFDAALSIYGSIEGVYDLLLCNPQLKINDILNKGAELQYNDDFILNDNTIEYFKTNKITPSNINNKFNYHKSEYPLLMVIESLSDNDEFVIELAGNGTVEIDWGDTSEILFVNLHNTPNVYGHSYEKKQVHKIKIYGSILIDNENNDGKNTLSKFSVISGLHNMYLFRPILIDEFCIQNNHTNTTCLSLIKGVYSVQLASCFVDNLEGLYNQRELQVLDLSNSSINQQQLEKYLIYLALNNNQRLGCIVTLSQFPLGAYREPEKDTNNKYIITSGMEAIWVIVHEESWNMIHPWKFIINQSEYIYEQNIK